MVYNFILIYVFIVATKIFSESKTHMYILKMDELCILTIYTD